MSNGAEREATAGRATPIHFLSRSVEHYEGEKAAFDRALEEAIQRAVASGDIEKHKELLRRLDQMTREFGDL